MLAQRRTRWANINPALAQRLVFDHLHDRKRWREMNGRLTDQVAHSDRLSQTERTGVKQYVPTSVYKWET